MIETSMLNSRLPVLTLILLSNAGVHAQNAEPPLPHGAIARLGTSRLVHIGNLESVVLSPDGKIVASGVQSSKGEYVPFEFDVEDKTDKQQILVGSSAIRLWDTQTGSLLREVQTPAGEVSALAFSADGSTLFARCSDFLCAFETATGKKQWEQKLNHIPGLNYTMHV